MMSIVVAALYKFTPFADPQGMRAPLRAACDAEAVRGTLLVAREGLNGTIAGSRRGIDAVLAYLRALPGCADLDVKLSGASAMPFARMKVRLKREIVTLGQPDADPTRSVGTYVAPAEWNGLVRSDGIVLIDTRNDYEIAIGSFPGAINPRTQTFREFPDWWRTNRERFVGRPVAMFCTGGIRCEKATSYLLSEGAEKVYHLRGGILTYLETVPSEESLWRGECYVFDGRVSVGHGLAPGRYEMCHACGRPISEDDKAHPAFEMGVRCPACAEDYDASDRARFRERQRQFRLAALRAPDARSD
jgi:UPF0176 protein